MMKQTLSALAVVAALAFCRPASAQVSTPPPDRDGTWGTITTVSLVLAAGTQILGPRFFYSDPEATADWRARWHVSALASTLTVGGLLVLNELAVKQELEGFRPGCDQSNVGMTNCDSYGMVSSHTFGTLAALGHGTSVFLVDSIAYSRGKVYPGAFALHVAAPAVLSAITMIGRGVGNWETPEQNLVGAAVGLGSGLITGAVYALMRRPSCGRGSAIVCW